jgi:predicted flap endonuclease-1-like 5' DNA nuclease
VTVIKGIGPAYGDRLEAVGIDTVADLATADAGEIAAETDLSEKRVSGWIDRARDR